MRSTSKLIRWFAVSAAIAAVLALSAERPVHGQTTGKPNIVVFLIDDLDVGTLDTLLAKGLMPNVKSYFVDAGYAFREAYSVHAVGGPSRATFLTGQYPHNHGMLGNYPPIGGITKLNPFSTLATWMNAAGYRTSLVGRYLTGYGWWTDPRAVPPGWDDWNALIEPGAYSMRSYSMNINRTIVDFGALATATGLDLYQTDVLSAVAGAAIRRAATVPDPLFLVVTPVIWNREIPIYNVCADPNDTGPFMGNFWGVSEQPATRHTDTVYGDEVNFPLPQPPSFDEADVEDKPDWVKANLRLLPEDIDCLKKRYWRKLEAFRAVDEMIGHVMSELQAAGKLANTVAFFTADNGLMDGQHRFPEKSPAYEEAIRIPLWIRLPGGTPPQTSTKLVMNTDLAPTITQFGGAVIPYVPDGRSLVPLIQNPASTPWRAIGLLAHRVEGSQTYDRFTGPPDYFAVRTDASRPRLYVRYHTVTTGLNGELYDLVDDPHQLQNLYEDPARQTERARLETWLNAMKTCRGLSCYLLENLFTFN